MPPEDEWDQHVTRPQGPRFEDDVLGLRGVTEHDPSLADDVLAADEGEQLRRRRRRRRNPVAKLLALILAGVLTVGAGIYGVKVLLPLLPSIGIGGPQEPDDFVGEGTGEVMVEIPAGAGGGQIAEILATEGVVASASGFTNELAANPKSSSIQPGTYTMAKQMSYASALSRLIDGGYRQIDGVTIREGLWVDETFAILAEKTGHDVKDYKAVDPESLDLPEAAEGDLEGFLFPSTYEFPEDSTPEQQLQMMVDLGKQKYAELGIPDDELREVIIRASIVQGEVAFADDMPKVATVMENRLKDSSETNGKMQMDSTVHFIYQERGLAGTTEEQRSNDSPYNTYVHEGLPPGPIDSPGEAAIKAVLDPTPGSWLYFVTVNPDTGETVFTDNLAEHEENAAKFEQWCADNADRC